MLFPTEMPADDPLTYPASFVQASLWRSLSAASSPAVYNLLWSLRLRGVLDSAVLRRALNRIIGRHESLRTVFVSTPEGFHQRILPSGAVDCGELRAEIVKDPDAVARDFGDAAFDIAEGPLCRFKLVRLDTTEHLLLCGFHHLVMDGHSWQLFVTELACCLAGKDLPLLTRQYRDFCAWQRRQVDDQRRNAARDYWKTLYGEASPSWDLPEDHPRPVLVEAAAESHVLRFSEETSFLLKERAKLLGTTPFRLAFAAFFALLHRVTGNTDLQVITTLIGRSHPDFAQLLGFFVNPAGVRLHIDGSTRFADLVARLAAQVDQGVAHQDYPFDVALRDANHRYEPAREPFSPVSFTKLPRDHDLKVAGIALSSERIFLGHAGHDLAVYLQDEGRTVQSIWMFRTALFDRRTIAAMAARYELVIEQVLAQPEMCLGQIDLVTEPERERILCNWNATDRRYPDAKPIHEMIEAQAGRTPDAIAVVLADSYWTYRRLNAAANRLARSLQARGAGPGSFVPILMESSGEFLVAELAVMKCGAAFVPLNPDWPAHRLGLLLEKLHAEFVLVRTRADAVRAGTGCEAIAVSCMEAADDEANLGIAVPIEAPIYCMFTSGSTGVPKGAINQHSGIANRFCVMTERFGSPVDYVVLVTTPAYFDAAVWQYFWPLTKGGRIVLLPTAQVLAQGRLPGLIGAHGITMTDFVPSVLRGVVEDLATRPEVWPSLCSLRRILVGGEAMAADTIFRLRQMLPQMAATNTYGPTETSIGIIFHEVPDEFIRKVPIGKPIPNVRAVILDPDGRLLPPGIAGELCVGGVCVGLGYLDDPEATAAAFVRNPFPELECETLYRTGDLAIFRTDGVIEYLGRIDQQVKLRGVRIEPGEIEAVLLHHPLVRQAVVALREEKSGKEALVAVLSAQPGTPPDAAGLRQFLASRLPAGMIPASFLLVDEIPVTPGGKLDRRAASLLSGVVLESRENCVFPRTETERRLCGLWTRLLGGKSPGIDEDFFGAGGDSLLAIEMINRLRSEDGFDVSLRTLYENTTIRLLAGILDQSAPENLEGSAVQTNLPSASDSTGLDSLEALLARQRPLIRQWKGWQRTPESFLFTQNEQGRKEGLFWCFQGFLECEQLAAHLGPDQPLTGMRSGHTIMSYSEANVCMLGAFYASEMLALQPSGPFVIGGNCQGAIIAQAIADELRRRGRDVALLILMEVTDFKFWDGPVALLFGRMSDLNPYKPGTDPDALFRVAYPGGFCVRIIEGPHGRFFEPENIPSLARTLQMLLGPR